MSEQENIVVNRDTSGALLSVNMIRPSNFHAHFRLGAMMDAIAYQLMRWVKYILAMPNDGLIDTVDKVWARYQELCLLRDTMGLPQVEIIVTVYATEKLNWRMIEALAALPCRVEIKYYPPHKGATTGSGHGIPLLEFNPDIFKATAYHGIPWLGHFETVTDKNGRVLPHPKREGYCMEHEFLPWYEKLPANQMVCIEHASTKRAIDIVKQNTSGRLVCGVTPHHMTISIDDLMIKSWANHGKCMPIPKGPEDVEACRDFATSGDVRAILGDDGAGHPSKKKSGEFWSDDIACGCWLPHSLAMYAMAFEQQQALDERFVQFACFNGADWRGLPRPGSHERVRLVAETEHDIPNPLPVPELDDVIIPLGWTTEPDRLKVGLALALEQALNGQH